MIPLGDVRVERRPLDEDFIVSSWLRSWARSRHGRAAGAHEPNTPEREAWWAAHSPYVTAIVRACEVRVLCRQGSPDVIYAWACVGPGEVHYVLAKTAAHEEALSGLMFRHLLADRLEIPQVYTHELRELSRAGIPLPAAWREDLYYWSRRAAVAAA